MIVDLRGMFNNVKSALKVRDPYAGMARFGLDELLNNLNTLRQEHEAGRGEAALTAFFACYHIGSSK